MVQDTDTVITDHQQKSYALLIGMTVDLTQEHQPWHQAE